MYSSFSSSSSSSSSCLCACYNSCPCPCFFLSVLLSFSFSVSFSFRCFFVSLLARWVGGFGGLGELGELGVAVGAGDVSLVILVLLLVLLLLLLMMIMVMIIIIMIMIMITTTITTMTTKSTCIWRSEAFAIFLVLEFFLRVLVSGCYEHFRGDERTGWRCDKQEENSLLSKRPKVLWTCWGNSGTPSLEMLLKQIYHRVCSLLFER